MHDIIMLRVITDNGLAYRSRAFATALGAAMQHKFTRPYCPHIDGKVESFNPALAAERAYAGLSQSETERAASYQA